MNIYFLIIIFLRLAENNQVFFKIFTNLVSYNLGQNDVWME